jgi:ABC-2 type transport system permease protein
MSEGSVRLSHVPSLRALAALLVLSLRQQIRGWRMIVLIFLFLLPSALVILEVATFPKGHQANSAQLDGLFVYYLMATALAPLAALLCAAGVIRDEVEEQTLTYLLLRPLPRSAINSVKLLAAMVVSAVLTIFFALLTLVVIDRLAGKSGGLLPMDKVLHAAIIFVVTQAAYCALFGLLGLIMRWSLVIGVGYIILFEGALASLDTLARKLTVMYYFRVLVLRWLNPTEVDWKIDLTTAPSAKSCVLTLLVASLVFVVIGAMVLSWREFRMKTPEGE